MRKQSPLKTRFMESISNTKFPSDEAMLQKYSLKPNDAILASPEHLPLYEDLLSNRSAVLLPGGAAQNTARGAQYMLAPHSTVYIGCVGKDKYADTLRAKNEEAGVHVEYLVVDTHPTGRCGVIITGQDRSMCTDLAAANEYKIEHLKSPAVWGLVQQAKVIFVGGYHLTVCVPAVLALAEEAAREDKPFIMSLSAPFIPLFFKDQLASTSKYWDYVIGNETEARSWAEGQGHETRVVAEIALLIAELPKENQKRKRTVIITQGTESTVVAVQGEKKVKTFGIRAVGKQEICDTTGAG